jgi:hypothetical protein
MSIARDMLRAWAAPRAVIRARAAGAGESQALAVIIGAGLLSFLAQWPKAARDAHLDPSIPLDARLGGALMATVFFLPLLAYAFSIGVHSFARLLGGKGTALHSRLALFWAFLAVTPMMLFQGLLQGFSDNPASLTFVQIIVGLGFLWILVSMLIEVHRTAAGPKASIGAIRSDDAI